MITYTIKRLPLFVSSFALSLLSLPAHTKTLTSSHPNLVMQVDHNFATNSDSLHLEKDLFEERNVEKTVNHKKKSSYFTKKQKIDLLEANKFLKKADSIYSNNIESIENIKHAIKYAELSLQKFSIVNNQAFMHLNNYEDNFLAEQISKKEELYDLLGTLYHRIFYFYEKNGDFDNFVFYHLKAIKNMEDAYSSGYVLLMKHHATRYLQLIESFVAYQRKKEALYHIKKLVEYYDDEGGEMRYIYNSVSHNLLELGELQLAKKYIDLTLEYLSDSSAGYGVQDIDALNQLAHFYMLTGRPIMALKALEKANSSIPPDGNGLGNNIIYAEYFELLGNVYLILKQPKKALYAFYKKSYHYDLGQSYPSYSTSRENSITLKDNYNLSKALYLNDFTLSAYWSAKKSHIAYINNRNLAFSNLDSKGREAFVQSNTQYTPHLLSVASTLLSKQSASVLQPTPEELKYTPELTPVSNDVIKSDTLSAWLNTKGALYDSENALAMLKHSTTDTAVLALIDELTAAKLLLASLYKKQQDDKVIERIKQTQSKIAELESQLASRSERYREELGLKNISTQDMSASLSDNQVYIDFAYTDDGYYVFSLDKQGNISFHHLDKSVSQRIDGLVKAFQSSISEYNTKLSERNGAIDRDEVIALGKAHKQQLSELYQLLFSNYPELLSKPELVISADGALRLLPFDALTDHAGNYLIESKTIRYIPSGKEWLRLSRQANQQTEKQQSNNQANSTDLTILYNPSYQTDTVKDKNVITNRAATPNTDLSQVKLIDLAFDNLAGTEKEGEAIVNLAKANHKTKIQDYSENQANKDNLLNTKNSDYLHIASHGFFINDKSIQNPMLKSGLALAGAKKGSYTGKVTALELMGMQLAGTDTVVLSACETGKVDITDTQGVSGLTKAFIQAGANNVIMSLWSVPDTATANLMQDYYKNTYNNQSNKQGKTNKAQALRQAKLSFIKQNKQPIDWAGFVISGSG